MPVVRGEEIRITDEELSEQNRPPHQLSPTSSQSPTPRPVILERVAKFIANANADEWHFLQQVMGNRQRELGLVQPKEQARFIDRALLYVYLNVTPFIIALLVVVPVVFFAGRALLQLRPNNHAGTTCPPACTNLDIFFWVLLGGIMLLTTFLFSYILRDRLLKAKNKG
ncbi:MAG: hypothetical protein BroJett015_07940 [Chloroflexota bacterium]|nr:hypothetical protein [Ardenticatenaceae bacterium]GIK55131.1 MAG: hypothetical protein BroJett015_07940 [Chloroflexota bacterium]